MRYTFNLKNPKEDKETLIYFSSYFKNEGKKFVYSTGETIHSKDWDFKYRQPNNLTGRTKDAEVQRTVKKQLDRYSNFFIELVNRYKNSNQDIDIEIVRDEFDKHFKKVKKNSSKFFEVYDLFIQEKKNDKSDSANSPSTIKRYEYLKTILEDFKANTKFNLIFNKIDQDFYNSFLNYCITIRKHSANTLRRNVGLLKTFLNWSLEKNYTYKAEFKNFKSPKPQVTDEIALSLEQVKEIYESDLSEKPKLQRVRDLFVFGCSTGMRISNYSKVCKNDIEDGYIKVTDKKNKDKQLKIPLNDFSLEILEKYDYELPIISTQKFNEYIKDVFEELKFDQNIKKVTRVGNEIIDTVQPFYERISSHTARRTFITVMKNKKIPDKVIMEFTGHKSLEVFNKYYKPNEEDKKNFMENVWKL
ncbi:tyrosine-type recombinase/integrase [Lutibacter sp.]|uniref:tyrosine-type recombinase/integrase n=1 Tax=Lutibacter sp. TaxID=1925666 RepID=UPI001A2004F5|nr:tyrosine-type recombinase/integrase [Lutibacter sp.]MBI9041686.1 tyrosine-type recombinase/integrase [Lutibacter sp.]